MLNSMISTNPKNKSLSPIAHAAQSIIGYDPLKSFPDLSVPVRAWFSVV
jgi:hypothetical protein